MRKPVYRMPERITEPSQVIAHLHFLRESYQLLLSPDPAQILAFLIGFNEACALFGFRDVQALRVRAILHDIMYERGWDTKEPLINQLQVKHADNQAIIDEMFQLFIALWKRVYGL